MTERMALMLTTALVRSRLKIFECQHFWDAKTKDIGYLTPTVNLEAL